jgi:serine/threonine protein kinase
LLRSKKDSKEYLMRVVTCATVADLERLKALLECRAQLRSQHILSLVEIKEKQQDYLCSIHYKMYLVLEYSFKNLAQEMRERCAAPERNPFQESDLWSILYSCCTALSTLYSSGATHESLSAEQVFINKDGFVKITEPLLFGL